MNVTGIIGFIILIILFNVLNKVLQAVAGRRQRPQPPASGEPMNRQLEPRLDERAREAVVFGDRDYQRLQTAEPDLHPAHEEPSYDETVSQEARAARTVESWIEEIFEGTSRYEPPSQRAEREPAVSERARDRMRRYTDFEESDVGVEREGRRGRERAPAREAPSAVDRASFSEPSAAVSETADRMLRMLKRPEGIRQIVLAAEILGPCRARIMQRRRMPRTVRSVLG